MSNILLLVEERLQNMKVSLPVEDIYEDCYVLANCHMHLVNHAMRNHNSNDFSDRNGENGDFDSNVTDDGDVSDLGVSVGRKLDPNRVQAASNEADKERELMLLQAAEHIKMARAQSALYQVKVAKVVEDATVGKEHAENTLLFLSMGRTWGCQSITKSSSGSHVTTAH